MHHVGRVGGLVAGAVRGVLERHPAVAGLRERAHHPRVQVTRLDRAHRPPGLLRRAVGVVERVAPQVGQLRHLVGVEQRPVGVGLDAAHELVRDPVGDVEVVRAPGVLAGVVAQLQELLDVRVPRLEVHARRALAPAALVDRGDGRVQRAQPRHDPVRVPVGAADQRAARAHPRPLHADAARELRQPRDLLVTLVDRLQLVARRVQQVARGHLGVPGAGVEQRRRAGQVRQRRHQPVEADRLRRRVRQSTRDTQQPVLRPLDHRAAVRVAQQVAVVDGAQAEVLEPPVGVVVHGVVELARVRGHERRGLVADQPLGVADRDRLAERVDALPPHLLVDVGGEQPGGEPRVLRLLRDELGRGLDRQPVQLLGGRAVVQAADRLRRHPQRVYCGQIPSRSARPRARSCPRGRPRTRRCACAPASSDAVGLETCVQLVHRRDRHGSLLASSG